MINAIAVPGDEPGAALTIAPLWNAPHKYCAVQKQKQEGLVMAEKVVVRYIAAHGEFPWSMNLADFVQISELPADLVPDDWKPISWQKLSKLFGEPIGNLWELGDAIDRRELRWSGDNTYNWGWWGPTLCLKAVDLEPLTEKEQTLIVAGVHLGGDVRGNYDWFLFLTNRHYLDVNPFVELIGGLELMMEVEEEDGTTHIAWCIDAEGCHWETDDEWLKERLDEILEKAAPWDVYPRKELEVEIGEDETEEE
jgi:hypothetical protein